MASISLPPSSLPHICISVVSYLIQGFDSPPPFFAFFFIFLYFLGNWLDTPGPSLRLFCPSPHLVLGPFLFYFLFSLPIAGPVRDCVAYCFMSLFVSLHRIDENTPN